MSNENSIYVTFFWMWNVPDKRLDSIEHTKSTRVCASSSLIHWFFPREGQEYNSSSSSSPFFNHQFCKTIDTRASSSELIIS